MGRYGSSLVLVATQEVREGALIPANVDPCIYLSDVQYCILEVVGCARQYGIYRTFLTNQYLKIDARSTFHHVKMLAAMNLITIKVFFCACSCVCVCMVLKHRVCTCACVCLCVHVCVHDLWSCYVCSVMWYSVCVHDAMGE